MSSAGKIEEKDLRTSNERLKKYIRDKVNHLLSVMGTKPLGREELDDSTLIELDPIGIIARSFAQVLEHQKETNRRLTVAKDQLQAVFDTAGVCISIIDEDMRIVNCNEKQKELLVSPDANAIGRHCYEIYCGKDSPSLDCPAVETLATGRPVFIREVKKKNKHFQIVTSPLKDSDGNVTGVIEVSMDVTEKKKAEELMHQAEKLTAIGLLAGGIAHELNNPLGNILGYATLVLKDRESGLAPEHREKLEIIVEQAKKGSDIIRGLLDFSRQSVPSFSDVAIDGIIGKTMRTLQNRFSSQRIKTDVALPGALIVRADPRQIELVVLNLLLNSIQAFEAVSRRDKTIRVGASRDGDFVRVSIADNGPGIPGEVLPGIFDPFFTTKPIGKGAGLGLSICSGIIKEHKGSIHVSSEAGRGTEFVFLLPASGAPHPVETR
ncbi:MAG: ATP-binding protein [Nitrospiraceae bacterium]|nr:ATP-binding protein [Nitrospiraceae bacterium]MDA8169081.1 ATP-binding protein [Nitrospiraceae bacterium]